MCTPHGVQNQIWEARREMRLEDTSAFYPDCQRLLMFSFEKKKNLNSEKHIPTGKILQDYRAITF